MAADRPESPKSGPPSKVNELEEGRLNIAITNLSKNESFIPDEKTKYIWLLTEDNQLLIGIEDVFEPKNLNAFDASGQQALLLYAQPDKKIPGESKPKYVTDMEDVFAEKKLPLNNTTTQLKRTLGHTTLTTKFKPTGETEPENAQIAGELFYVGDNEPEKSSGWYINNTSGRYHTILGDDKKAIKQAFKEVIPQMERLLKIKIITQMGCSSDKFDPKAIWDKSNKKQKQGNQEQKGWTEVDHAAHLMKKFFRGIYSKGSPKYNEEVKKIEANAKNMTTLSEFITFCDHNKNDFCGNNLIMAQKFDKYVKFLNETNEKLKKAKNEPVFSADLESDNAATNVSHRRMGGQ